MILVDEPGFRRVQTLLFLDLGLGSAHFRLNMFEVWAILGPEVDNSKKNTIDKTIYENARLYFSNRLQPKEGVQNSNGFATRDN